MLKRLEPQYQVPHRKTFMERVLPDLYVKVKEMVTPITAAADCYAITTDCWTSRANEAYVGVTFHTITDEWQLQHFILENESSQNSTQLKILQKLWRVSYSDGTLIHPSSLVPLLTILPMSKRLWQTPHAGNALGTLSTCV